MNKEIIFVIIGPARAGKTTFAKYLSEITALKASGTSDVVHELVAFARGCTVGDLRKLPKEELRPCLIKAADYVCDIYPDILSIKLINDGFRIIEGIRRESEFEELSYMSNFKMISVYINRPNGTTPDNFNIPKEEADCCIENDGDLNDLRKKATKFFNDYFDCVITRNRKAF